VATTQPILIHAFSGPLGGSERILLDLLRRMDRPAVLACPPGHLADCAEGDGVTVVRVKSRPLEARHGAAPAVAAGHMLGHGREIRSLAKDLEPSMILSWGMRSAIAATSALKRLQIPLVAEHVDLLPSGPQGELARRALLKCDRVICLSEAIARDLDPAWHASGRISVVHPGVQLPEAAEARRGPAPVALVLAAIEPWKDQATALEAAALIPDLKLIVAGAPISSENLDYLTRLESRASLPDLRGRVEFPGLIDGGRALEDATLLVHPAPAEPFGRALIDALAAGRPVVACRSAGPAEIITPDCGRLVPPGDTAAFAQAIEEITSDAVLAHAMGEAGRRRVASMFDAETQATKWQRTAFSLAPMGLSEPHTGPSALDSQIAATDHNGPGASLSLVSVIHDSAPDIARLLSSVSRHLPGAEVIVVDSGSTDGGSSVASTWPGGASVLSLDGNAGYGAGCVLGIGQATRPITVLINPDVELVDASLDSLASELIGPLAPDRILSPVLIHPDGTRQDAVHPLPGTPAELLRALVPAPALPGRLSLVAEPHRSESPLRVGWAVGACLVARTATLKSLGPFDPRVHLYAEDLDLCLRAADAGVETWYMPNSRVIHREGHSTRNAFVGEPSELLARRRRAVVGQRLGTGAQWRDDAIQYITHADRMLIKSILRRDTQRERNRIAGLRKARRSR